MKRLWILGSLLLLAPAALAVPAVTADDTDQFRARLNSYEEVPSKSTTGIGRFRARLVDGGTIAYELSYSNVEGSAFAAHIHFGQRHTNGGVSAFLCGGGGKDPCPPAGGTVTGTVKAADVIGPADQGIEANSFGELIRAMRAGAAYVNVHTNPRFPGGEIRGQVEGDRGNEGD